MRNSCRDESKLLRWWHQHQAQKLGQVSDRIRNGLLQELFAVRRQLEISSQEQRDVTAYNYNRLLADLERIYDQLEHLSHDLNSPFVNSCPDSLPIALQHAVQPWKDELTLNIELPITWPTEPIEHVRLFINVVDTFFSPLATNNLKKTKQQSLNCGIELIQWTTAGTTTKKLTCYASGNIAFFDAYAESLSPLLETFQILTQGEYHQILQPQQIEWTLHWQSPSPLPVNHLFIT